MLSTCLTHSLEQWGIDEKQVLLVVTDNGSNMVKAIKLLQENNRPVAGVASDEGDLEIMEDEEGEQGEEGDDDDEEVGMDSETEGALEESDEDNQFTLPEHVPFRRMPCMAHTLQLVIKLPYKHYETVLTKTRHLVGRIRKSSVAVEKLIDKSGKSVVSDCTTRWNSTHHMIKRILAIKTNVNEVLTEIGQSIV
jgi:hypothetical protein